MHSILARHLRRHRLDADSLPLDPAQWASFLQSLSQTLSDADNDRDLLERSLAISSDEMGTLHTRLADERDMIDSVICSLAEGVCALDGQQKIVFLNPEAARILSLPKDTALGQPLANVTNVSLPDGRPLVQLLNDAKLRDQHSDIPLKHLTDSDLRIVCAIASLKQISNGCVLTLRDVTERERVTRERDALHKQLLDASRRAGMAEIATSVLHNVGNVLNSVNVSATLLTDQVRKSELSSVTSLANLLPADPQALASFITQDERGRLVPSFLNKLGAQLSNEQSRLLEELTGLVTNIEHIREIVNSQQSYARGGTVMSDVDLAEVVAEAIKINEAALQRHHVSLVTDYIQMPTIQIDRHKVLQILVNLISNAKYAVQDRNESDRAIRVHAAVQEHADSPRIVLSVVDNGVGMTDEVRSRLFQHGFSTRPDGHGFGLHYCALAAKELGGELLAHSDGPGRGAAFTLILPCQAAAEAVI